MLICFYTKHVFPIVPTEGRIMMDHVKYESLRSAESERDISGSSDKTRIPIICILAKCNVSFRAQQFGLPSCVCSPDYNRHDMATSVCFPHLCDRILMLQIYEIIFSSFSSYQIL
jgi:hypothetical protein